MFEGINFERTETRARLTSKKIVYDELEEKGYNEQAIANANFSISGKVDAFVKPPIAEFAIANLFHMEAFDRFYYDKGSFTERLNYNSFLIGYTYSGQGLLKYNDKEYSLSEGDGFYIDCNTYHYYAAISDVWDVAILHIGGPLLSYHHNQYMQYSSPIFHDSVSGNTQNYFEQLLSLYNQPIANRDWLVSGCINNLLLHLLNKKTDEAAKDSTLPDNIRYLVKYIDNNYSRPLTLDYLSDFAGISKYYLSREFKKYTGFSPNDYIITLRINRAKYLLTNTTLPAVKIAHEVGIHDNNNFINLFRKKTGTTPANYRKGII